MALNKLRERFSFLTQTQKIILSVGGVLLLASLVSIILFLAPTKIKEKEVLPQFPTIPWLRRTPKLVNQTLNYFDSQKQESGYYRFQFPANQPCGQETEGQCAVSEDKLSKNANAWATLAHLAVYRIGGDTKLLEKAEQDFEPLLTVCRQDSKGCLWILVQLYELNKETNLKYRDDLVFLGEHLLENSYLDRADSLDSQATAMLTAIEAKELALLYQGTNNTAFLNEAIKRTREAEALIKRQTTNYFLTDGQMKRGQGQDVCWQKLAALELARATGDNSWVQEAKSFFDSPKFIHDGQSAVLSLTAVEPCVESLYTLFELTTENQYRDLARQIMKNLVANYGFEQKEGQWFYLASGPVRNFQITFQDNPNVTITDNAYFLHLLSLDKQIDLLRK